MIFEKTLHGVVATVSVANWCKFGCSAIFRFGVTFVPATQVCDFYHFEIYAKTFHKYKNW